MRHALHRLLRIGIFVCPIVIGWVVFTDLRTIRATDTSIARQEAVVDSLRGEVRALKKQLRDEGEAIAKLPESARLGRAVDSGSRIAKRQENVEGLVKRGRNRIKNLETIRADARSHMIQWAIPLVVVWSLLGFVSWRTKRSPTTT
jgi:hypothetical protein